MSKQLNNRAIAKKNIENKPVRNYSLMALTGFLCFVLFLSTFLIYSVKNGLHSLSDRMGADIIVVPEGYDSKISGAILRGEPNSFFFERSIFERLQKIEGIEKATPQQYLATLSAGCCSYPIQVIGFDSDTDFLVKPWLEQQVKLPLKQQEVVVGHDVVGDIHSNVKFFNQEFKIKGRLAKTGMGFDTSVFMNFDETVRLAKEYEKILELPISKHEDMISSIMIKVKPDASAQEVSDAIRKEFQGEGVYPLLSKQMMNEVSTAANSLLTYIYTLIVLIWLLALILLLLVYSISIRERKREFAMYRILGATKKKLNHMVLTEVLMINIRGSVVGTGFALAVALLFSSAISKSLNLPFLAPNYVMMFLIFVFTVLIGSLIGPLSASFAIAKMNRQEMAVLLREND